MHCNFAFLSFLRTCVIFRRVGDRMRRCWINLCCQFLHCGWHFPNSNAKKTRVRCTGYVTLIFWGQNNNSSRISFLYKWVQRVHDWRLIRSNWFCFDVRQSFKAVEWLEIISETSEPHRRQERPLAQSMKGKKILGLALKKWNLSKITYYAEIGHICHLLQRK